TIQAMGPPQVNPYLPYRSNPSYYAVPATLSLDLGPEGVPQFSARIYAGGSIYFHSGVPASSHPDARAGFELRYGTPAPASDSNPSSPTSAEPSAFLPGAKGFGVGHGALGDGAAARGAHGRQLRRGTLDYVLAYEALVQREFSHDPTAPGEPVFIVDPG